MGLKGKKHLPNMQIGEVHGRLTVIGIAPKDPSGRARLLCRCECGNEKIVKQGLMRSGHTRSCGCIQYEWMSNGNPKHGLRHHPLYDVWIGMRDRCYNPNNAQWRWYGGKGIKVCDKWLNDVRAFYDDVIVGYVKGLALDRISSEGDYEPNNVQWVTQKVNNQKSNRAKLNYQKAAHIRTRFASVKDMAFIYNVNPNAITDVLKNRTWI